MVEYTYIHYKLWVRFTWQIKKNIGFCLLFENVTILNPYPSDTTDLAAQTSSSEVKRKMPPVSFKLPAKPVGSRSASSGKEVAATDIMG